MTSLVAALSSCRKGDDLYINPNQPTVATPATLLTGVEANTFMNYEAGMGRIAAIWMQYQTGFQAQSLQINTYDVTGTDMDNFWTGLYVGAMKNAKILYTSYEGKDPYYAGIAKVNMAMNLGMATQLWGDVPYSQAFQLETSVNQPQMDKQSAIFADIQTLLDQAIADFAQPASANLISPAGDDLVFGGDASKWAKTAWTLKARYHNLASKRDPNASANVLADLANGIASNADNCLAIHNGSNDQNQWAAFQASRTYNGACQTLIDSMGNMNDPRTPWYFDTTSSFGSGPVGAPFGTHAAGSLLGPYLFDAAEDLPSPLVTYAEAMFLKAEALARNNDPNTFVALNAAILASVSDVRKGDTTGYYMLTKYTAGTASVHKVMTEKWKAMFAQPLESYADFRRTGFPMLKPYPNAALSYIPQRFPTDLAEESANPNAVFIPLNTPVWFAQ
jgi:hypothetical protein